MATATEAPDVLLNRSRIAERFGVTWQTVKNWQKAGKLPPPTTTFGGSPRWAAAVIDQLIKSRDAAPTS